MTRAEADELADFVAGLITCESVAVRPYRPGAWRLTVRMVGEPPRTFTDYAAAFRTYCAGDDDAEID